jgi:hypothetical protein
MAFTCAITIPTVLTGTAIFPVTGGRVGQFTNEKSVIFKNLYSRSLFKKKLK